MPAAPSPAWAIFEKLAQDFSFDVKIADRLLDLKLESFNDFWFYVQDETEIEKAFVEGVPDLTNPRIQLARACFAWASCVAEAKVGEVRKLKEVDRQDDEEAVLPKEKLEELKTRFWNRYHLSLSPAEWPSDRLLSRLWKVLGKRNMEVEDLWVVRSLLFQKTTSTKKHKVGDSGISCTSMILRVAMTSLLHGVGKHWGLRWLRRPLAARIAPCMFKYHGTF